MISKSETPLPFKLQLGEKMLQPNIYLAEDEPLSDPLGQFTDSNGLTRGIGGGDISMSYETESKVPLTIRRAINTELVALKQLYPRTAVYPVRKELYAAYFQKNDPTEPMRSIVERALANANIAQEDIAAQQKNNRYASLVRNMEPTIAALEIILGNVG